MIKLIKKIIILFAFIFSFVQIPVYSQVYDRDELINISVYEKITPAIVTIDAQLPDGISSGTGCVIAPSGIILTSSHVIDNSADIDVTIHSGKVYKGTIISILGKNNDLALIKIKSDETLPIIRLGDSESLKVGQKVLAIGNPFGFSYTLTQGIISRIDYSKNKIQTDAAINPGNSGGPLLNSQGEVIGISQSIYNPDNNKSNIGIGFAVPVNAAKEFIELAKIAKKF
ncbi:MAG: trypsin-like peptidase domain-containing protein [Candidatus Gastranaerophilales bacterium]|nr:trypsin-like peptidase domain-containing protein [Candidatus Gastranaerophilales bacterium]